MNAQVYTFWETVKEPVPPYVKLGIASAYRVFGQDFNILNSTKCDEMLSEDNRVKDWKFRDEWDLDLAKIRTVVAKSDFYRMRIVGKRGGFWIDADSVVLGDFRDEVNSLTMGNSQLWWNTEAFFGCDSPNEILIEASRNMLEAENQTWGNPGLVKDLIRQHPESVSAIPNDLVDPGVHPTYNFRNSSQIIESGSASKFLRNPKAKMIKLYNTAFRETGLGKMGVEEFLQTDSVLANLFLKLEPSINYWVEVTTQLKLPQSQ